jgi:23S rRNA (cytidine1920-2'-O)/16S rRNA (cytidine1409-2'-O)-methyltransferase
VGDGGAARYVGRGGLKLEKALKVFGLKVEGFKCLDLGSSTGGFVDCLLKSGAARVYAVDVGYGQLDMHLRRDPRVVCLERTNARYLTENHIPEKVDLVTGDLSFISLTLIFPVASSFLEEDGGAVFLIKPQFEAGIKKVRRGVVRDPEVHEEVIARARDSAARARLNLIDITWSPLKGPAGNIEFFGYFRREALQGTAVEAKKIAEVVKEAHSDLSQGPPA